MSLSVEPRNERRAAFWRALAAEYEARYPASRAMQAQAAGRLTDGGSHTARLFAPHTAWVRHAQGAYIDTVDGHRLLDLWQGHFANILGHSPTVVTTALTQLLQSGHGLQSGMQDVLEWELADVLCRQLGVERIRFTTSGSLATMYALLLARAFTGRDLVLKVGGGWHGAQPWGLKGVHFGDAGYSEAETRGLPAGFLDQVLVTPFNDVDALGEVFRKHGDRIAGFIVEPFLGGGGMIAGQPEFVRAARQLTQQYGAVLICDEVISGFRFGAGAISAMYGIEPDLTTIGKIIGGGMPVAAVAGRNEIMRLAGREGGQLARFEGGTYSAHPLSMLAGLTMVRHLIAGAAEIYPALATAGDQMRQAARAAFGAAGIQIHLTGLPGAILPGSSFMSIHFPMAGDAESDLPQIINDPARYDVEMRERVMRLAFVLEGVYVIHAGGALSSAHGAADLARISNACQRVARRMQAAGF
jgi:glutamate-1-semialdehyde 2,1-aminomutase